MFYKILLPVCLLLTMGCRFSSDGPKPQRLSVNPSGEDQFASNYETDIAALAEAAAANFRVPDHRHVVVIDFDRSLLSDRLFVVEMRTKKIVLRSRVSHALKSGLIYASDFSNTPESEKSCIGAFRTAESYYGKFGYALRIDGLERGVNDNARRRAIVFHDFEAPVAYSEGCFITPPDVNRRLIDLIKGGSLVYVRKS